MGMHARKREPARTGFKRDSETPCTRSVMRSVVRGGVLVATLTRFPRKDLLCGRLPARSRLHPLSPCRSLAQVSVGPLLRLESRLSRAVRRALTLA